MKTKEEYLAEAQKIVAAQRKTKLAITLHAQIEVAAQSGKDADIQVVANALEALDQVDRESASADIQAEALTK